MIEGNSPSSYAPTKVLKRWKFTLFFPNSPKTSTSFNQRIDLTIPTSQTPIPLIISSTKHAMSAKSSQEKKMQSECEALRRLGEGGGGGEYVQEAFRHGVSIPLLSICTKVHLLNAKLSSWNPRNYQATRNVHCVVLYNCIAKHHWRILF